ncbi:MAG: winged helix-turn-helix domain-containing protein [Chitinophaga sp.]|uniref:winged helix-turn-helix domain-containing protein n=1 Tax=Chitinophaga sp. TaxID=1869181 RepID=UPI001B00B168|nr:winged helix-turn-helix domain-containing protein [Chitinophaga sp.]MBO9728978.1 winged helix-turn-helix domain-containing protein [Chitinophaga sp.]
MKFPESAFEYDEINYELVSPKMRIPLSTDYHNLMMCFLATPNKVVPMENLLKAVAGDNNKLRVYISHLRENFRLMESLVEIENKHNKGYVLKVKL